MGYRDTTAEKLSDPLQPKKGMKIEDDCTIHRFRVRDNFR